MKVSVSLPNEDVAFVDAYAQAHACRSRSAVVHQAIDALRASDLYDAYREAWQEWADSGEAQLWDAVAGDGL